MDKRLEDIEEIVKEVDKNKTLERAMKLKGECKFKPPTKEEQGFVEVTVNKVKLSKNIVDYSIQQFERDIVAEFFKSKENTNYGKLCVLVNKLGEMIYSINWLKPKGDKSRIDVINKLNRCCVDIDKLITKILKEEIDKLYEED